MCTTTMTNIRPDRDSNLVPPGYKPQSIRMSHRGRPFNLNVTRETCLCSCGMKTDCSVSMSRESMVSVHEKLTVHLADKRH